MLKNACLSVVAATALFAGVAHASTDYLIRVDGIEGTSTVVGFEDYIPIESWSLGVTRGLCQALHFVKLIDKSSAEMTRATLLGSYYPVATLVALKAGGDGRNFVYMKLTLTNSVFMSFQTGGSNGSSILPMEQISLQPSAVKFEIFEQTAGGSDVELIASSSVTCQKPK